MKQILITLLLATSLLAQRPGMVTKNQNVEWDYRISAGTITTYSGLVESVTLTGALDTMVSRYYDNVGSISAQLTITGGTTNVLKVIVQTCNMGEATLADSMFKDTYWIHWAGMGHDSCYVNTKVDSCTDTDDVSSAIFIPTLRCDKYRFYAITKSTQSGNPTLSIRLRQKEY